LFLLLFCQPLLFEDLLSLLALELLLPLFLFDTDFVVFGALEGIFKLFLGLFLALPVYFEDYVGFKHKFLF